MKGTIISCIWEPYHYDSAFSSLLSWLTAETIFFCLHNESYFNGINRFKTAFEKIFETAFGGIITDCNFRPFNVTKFEILKGAIISCILKSFNVWEFKELTITTVPFQVSFLDPQLKLYSSAYTTKVISAASIGLKRNPSQVNINNLAIFWHSQKFLPLFSLSSLLIKVFEICQIDSKITGCTLDHFY